MIKKLLHILSTYVVSFKYFEKFNFIFYFSIICFFTILLYFSFFFCLLSNAFSVLMTYLYFVTDLTFYILWTSTISLFFTILIFTPVYLIFRIGLFVFRVIHSPAGIAFFEKYIMID